MYYLTFQWRFHKWGQIFASAQTKGGPNQAFIFIIIIIIIIIIIRLGFSKNCHKSR